MYSLLLTWHSRLAPEESPPSFPRSSFEKSSSQRYSFHETPNGSSSDGSSSRTSVVDEKEYEAGSLEREKEAYDALVAANGQPSHPISLGFDVLNNPGQYEDILWALHSMSSCYMSEFRVQLIYWQRFRDYQKDTRERYVKRGRFQDYQNIVRKSQEGVQFPWDLDVDKDNHRQSRLQDWIEFRAYNYRKLKAKQRRFETVAKNYQQRKGEMDALESGSSSPTEGGDIFAMESEAERRVQVARDKLIAAERELVHAKAANEPREEAEQEVQLADKRLELQYNLRNAESALYREQRQVKIWAVYLKWIDDQYLLKAAQCGYDADGIVHGTVVSKGASLKENKLKYLPRRGRRMQSRPVLGPTSPSKVLKSSRSKPHRRPKPQPRSFGNPPPKTEQVCSVRQPLPLRRSERIRKSKIEQVAQGPGSRSLRPIHSSRVGKAKANVSAAKQRAPFPPQSARTEQPPKQPRRR